MRRKGRRGGEEQEGREGEVKLTLMRS